MAGNDNTRDTLVHMGLSEYEAEAYIALSSLVSSTASGISRNSGVPRSKIYGILDRLRRKGYLEISHGRPRRYTVVPPVEVFEREKKLIEERMEMASSHLSAAYESDLTVHSAPIWLVQGVERMLKKEVELIDRARHDLYIIAGLFLPKEEEMLVPAIERASARGVRIRILHRSFCMVDGTRVDIGGIMDGVECERKALPIPYIKSVIRDEREMLMIFCRFEDDNAVSQTAMGLWHQYPEFCGSFTSLFNMIWGSGLMFGMDQGGGAEGVEPVE